MRCMHRGSGYATAVKKIWAKSAAADQDFPKCFDLASPGRIPCPTWACAPAADLAFGPSKHRAERESSGLDLTR